MHFKDADHAEDRFKERLGGAPPELLERARAAEKKIPPGPERRMHVPLRHEGRLVGFAAYKRVGNDNKPVLATILGPDMNPRRSHTLPESLLDKAAALKKQLASATPAPSPFAHLQEWYGAPPVHHHIILRAPGAEHVEDASHATTHKTAATKTRLFAGLRVRVDRPKGYVQKGKDSEGKPWERTYQCDYGYLAGTQGGDGDGLDVFLGPDEGAKTAWLIRQVDKNGRFDEFKLMLGFKSKEAARDMYLKHVPLRFLGPMEAVDVGLLQGLTGRPVQHEQVTLAKTAATQALLRSFDAYLKLCGNKVWMTDLNPHEHTSLSKVCWIVNLHGLNIQQGSIVMIRASLRRPAQLAAGYAARLQVKKIYVVLPSIEDEEDWREKMDYPQVEFVTGAVPDLLPEVDFYVEHCPSAFDALPNLALLRLGCRLSLTATVGDIPLDMRKRLFSLTNAALLNTFSNAVLHGSGPLDLREMAAYDKLFETKEGIQEYTAWVANGFSHRMCTRTPRSGSATTVIRLSNPYCSRIVLEQDGAYRHFPYGHYYAQGVRCHPYKLRTGIDSFFATQLRSKEPPHQAAWRRLTELLEAVEDTPEYKALTWVVEEAL